MDFCIGTQKLLLTIWDPVLHFIQFNNNNTRFSIGKSYVRKAVRLQQHFKGLMLRV